VGSSRRIWRPPTSGSPSTPRLSPGRHRAPAPRPDALPPRHPFARAGRPPRRRIQRDARARRRLRLRVSLAPRVSAKTRKSSPPASPAPPPASPTSARRAWDCAPSEPSGRVGRWTGARSRHPLTTPPQIVPLWGVEIAIRLAPIRARGLVEHRCCTHNSGAGHRTYPRAYSLRPLPRRGLPTRYRVPHPVPPSHAPRPLP
jgi:hypothetical protein